MRKVYLDNASTTPLIPEVKDAMLPYMEDLFGNPSSLHDWGTRPGKVWRPPASRSPLLLTPARRR